MWFIALGSFAVIVWLLAKYYFESYWRLRGFPSLESTFPFGCLGPLVRKKTSINGLFRDLHLNAKHGVTGIFLLFRPALLVTDPELIKSILITDFANFSERGIYVDKKNDPLFYNILNMHTEDWQVWRKKLSVLFTPAKLRMQVPLFNKTTDLLLEHFSGQSEVRLQKVILQLTGTFSASNFFGTDWNAMKDSGQKEFDKMSKVLGGTSFRNTIVNFGMFLFPTLLRLLKISPVEHQSKQYLKHLVNSIRDLRKKENQSGHGDAFQLINDLHEQLEATEDEIACGIAAAAFMFYLASIDTTSTTISNCLYEIIRDEEVLQKVRDEIDPVMQRRNGHLEYEDVNFNELPFLSNCISETMRKYTAAPMINRLCVSDYRVPGSDQVIRKGTPIIISVAGIHMDERLYPKPNEFQPDRFQNKDLLSYHFGIGPRSCIGSRLALMLAKFVICKLLHHFDMTLMGEMNFGKDSLFLTDSEDMPIRVKRRIL